MADILHQQSTERSRAGDIERYKEGARRVVEKLFNTLSPDTEMIKGVGEHTLNQDRPNSINYFFLRKLPHRPYPFQVHITLDFPNAITNSSSVFAVISISEPMTGQHTTAEERVWIPLSEFGSDIPFDQSILYKETDKVFQQHRNLTKPSLLDQALSAAARKGRKKKAQPLIKPELPTYEGIVENSPPFLLIKLIDSLNSMRREIDENPDKTQLDVLKSNFYEICKPLIAVFPGILSVILALPYIALAYPAAHVRYAVKQRNYMKDLEEFEKEKINEYKDTLIVGERLVDAHEEVAHEKAPIQAQKRS